MSASQRIAWWLLRTARLRSTLTPCKRCGGCQLASWDPDPRFGWGIWSRCLLCGRAVLELCQPHGERRPFVPPVPWQTIEEEIAAMRAAHEAPYA